MSTNGTRAKCILAVAGLLVCMAAAMAATTWEYNENVSCEMGGDVRLRLTHVDRDALMVPPAFLGPGSTGNGPALEYARLRLRVYGCVHFGETASFTARLTNRMQWWSSRHSDSNNIYNEPSPTWAPPDEIIVDNLYLDLPNVLDTGWSLRIGRQDFILGKGMVVLEGTPFDQGRTIYMDGITARFANECDKLTVFGFKNDYKDRWGDIVNQQNRPLRRGNTLLAGIDWIHTWAAPNWNTELYYVFADIDDKYEASTLGQPPPVPANDTTELHIVGARLFGAPSKRFDYSVEVARQFGDKDMGAADDSDLEGWMVDARTTFKAAEDTLFDPVLGLEYTYMSGDDPKSVGDIEGWHPSLAEYPIWREELFPLRIWGAWTNLHQARMQLVMKLHERVKLTTAYAALWADEGKSAIALGGGNGKNIGQIGSAFLDIGVLDNLTVSLEASHFWPGNHWFDGQSAEWLRLQTVLKF